MFPSSPIRLSLGAISFSAAAILLAGTTAIAQMTIDVQVPFNLSTLTPALASPLGVAVAPDGTVYVADIESATTGRVIAITPSGTVGGTSGGPGLLTTTSVTTLAPTIGGTPVILVNPNAVAVDSAGDLYIADIKADKVYELTAPETSPAAIQLDYTGAGPTAIAIGAANAPYVADSNGNIYQFPVPGGPSTALPIGSTTYKPVGLAVDSVGDVIFASAAENQLYEYSPTTTATTVFLAAPSTGSFEFSTATAGLPIGMGFDPAGNLYVLDSAAGALWQIPPIATPIGPTTFQWPFNASTTTPGSLAVSRFGHLYLSDDSTPTAVAEIFFNANPVNLGTIQAGVNSPIFDVNVNVYSADSGLAQYQVIQGDYTGEIFPTGTATGTCTGAVGMCHATLEANYSASTPGLRNGSIGIIDGAGNVFAVHIVGVSGAAGLALYPGNQNKLSATSSQTIYEPQGAAVSGDGKTFFIADEGGVINGSTPTYPYPAVYAYTASGGIPTGTPATVGSFTYPMAVALDSLGNLYVADYSGYVTEFPPTFNTTTGATSWSGFGTRLSLPGVTLIHPMSLTVDIYNNLYIGDMGSGGVNATSTNPGYIVKVPGDGGPATQLNYVVNGTPVIFPDGLTTDSYGNLFISDGGDGVVSNGGVDVVPIATGQASAISFGTYAPLNLPTGVALDAANDLYVADSYNSRILVVPITYSGTVPTAVSAGISNLGGSIGGSGLSTVETASSIVVWPDQNTLTVTDLGYQAATGSSYPVQVLTLTSQNVPLAIPTGSTSASLKGFNVGNLPITFLSPTISNPNFSLSGCGADGSTLGIGIAANPACTATVNVNSSGTGQGTTIMLNASAAQDGSTLGNVITVAGPPAPPEAQISPTSSTSQTGTITVENIGGGTLTISGITATGGTLPVGTSACVTGTNLTNDQTCNITYDVAAPPACSNTSGFLGSGTCTSTNTETVTITSNGADNTATLTGTYSYSVTYVCLFGACAPFTLDRSGSTPTPAFAPDGTPAPASHNSTSTALTSRGFTGLTF